MLWFAIGEQLHALHFLHTVTKVSVWHHGVIVNVSFQLDSEKIMTTWQKNLNATGRPILISNCHNKCQLPGQWQTWCPGKLTARFSLMWIATLNFRVINIPFPTPHHLRNFSNALSTSQQGDHSTVFKIFAFSRPAYTPNPNMLAFKTWVGIMGGNHYIGYTMSVPLSILFSTNRISVINSPGGISSTPPFEGELFRRGVIFSMSSFHFWQKKN